MKNFISPAQTSFVARRYITDNIILVQEILYHFWQVKGKRGFVPWKVDLSKAYDRMN